MIRDTRTRMTDPEDLDCNGDVTVYHSELDNVPWEAESRPDYEPPDKPFFGSRMDSLAAPLTRPGMEHPAAWNSLSLGRHPEKPESSPEARKRARELLKDDAPTLSDREIIAVFRRFRRLSESGDVA